MKKIMKCFIVVTILSLPISSWAGKEKNLNLDSGSAGSKSKFSIVRKAVVLAPVTLLAGGVLNIVNNLQKTQPPVAIKTQLLAKFKDYQSKLPEDFTLQEQIDAFIKEKYVEIYLDLMRNVNLNQGPVLWGGDLEIAAIVLKYKIGIRVIDNDQGTDKIHGEEYETKITIKRKDGHYKYIDVLGKEFDVPGDGNCMFTAILRAAKAKKVKIFPRNIIDLRSEVIEYIEKDDDLKVNIVPDNDGNGEKIDGEHTLEEIVNNILNNKYVVGRYYCKNMIYEEINTLLDKLAKNQLTDVEKEKAEAVLIYKKQQKSSENEKSKYALGRDYCKNMTDEEINTLLDKLAKKQLIGIEKEKAESVLMYNKKKKSDKKYCENKKQKYVIGKEYCQNMTDEEISTLLDKLAKNQLIGVEKERAEAVLIYKKRQKNNENKKPMYALGRKYCQKMTDEEINTLLDKLAKKQLIGIEKEKAESVLIYKKQQKSNEKYYKNNRKPKYVLGREYCKNMTDEEINNLLDKLAKNQLTDVEKKKAESVLMYYKQQKNNEKSHEKQRKNYAIGREYCKNMTAEEKNTLLDKLAKNQLMGAEKEKAEAVFSYKKQQEFYDNRNEKRRQKYVIGKACYETMTNEEIDILLNKLFKKQLVGVEKEKAEAILYYEKTKDMKLNKREFLSNDEYENYIEEENEDEDEDDSEDLAELVQEFLLRNNGMDL